MSDADALIESLEQLIAKKRQIKQGAMQQLLTGRKRLPGFDKPWKTLQAGDIGKFRGGSGFPNKFQGNIAGAYPFLKVSDMNKKGNEIFIASTNNYIGESAQKQIGAIIFPSQTIVFAKVGAAIFLERKRILARPSCIDNNMVGYVINAALADIRFMHYALIRTNLGDLVSTTALPALNGNVLATMQLSLPAIDEQTAIAEILSDMDAEITELETRLAKARQIKQGMMQQLLTGRIRLVKPQAQPTGQADTAAI